MVDAQAPPILVDAVRASASKLQGLKSAIEARARELDRLKEQLDSQRSELGTLAARLESDRRSIESEREEVRAGRASLERDLAAARDDREHLSAEQARLQSELGSIDSEREEVRAGRASLERDLAAARDDREHLSAEQAQLQELTKTLEERENSLREAEGQVERLDHEMIGRMRESAAKFLAIVDREEEITKMQRDWLVAVETREKELRTINEELRARQEESAELGESLGQVKTLFKDEMERLAARRDELAAKEASLLEAQRYLARVVEAAEAGPSEQGPPTAAGGAEQPATPDQAAPAVSPSGAQPIGPVRAEAPEPRTPVMRSEAMERLTRAIEAWKRARDSGWNVAELRNTLKRAKDALQSGDYDTSFRLSSDVLEALRAAVIPA